jgi:hypothetical protein
MPQVFYGTVYVGDTPVPAGVQVEARGTGIHVDTEGNPIVTTTGGLYGGPGSYDPKLIVQGEISSGAKIGFYVNGAKAECRNVAAGTGWQADFSYTPGKNTNLDLRVDTLPTITVTATTTATTATATVTGTATGTATVTATQTSSSTGGGGGGGGGSYGAIYDFTSATTGVTAATTQATISPMQTSTYYPQPTYSRADTPVQTMAVSSPETTATQEAPYGENLPIPPMNQLVIYGAAVVILITAISLVAVGKYEGWFGRKGS